MSDFFGGGLDRNDRMRMRLGIASGVLGMLVTAAGLAMAQQDVVSTGPASRAAMEGPGIQGAKVDVEKLKEWGTKEYVVIRQGKGVSRREGEFVLKTTVEKDRVVLEDKVEIAKRGVVVTWTSRSETAKDGALSLRTQEAKGNEAGFKSTVKVAVKDGKGTATLAKEGEKGEEQTFDYRDNTVTVFGLMRVFTILPREEGGKWGTEKLFNDFKLRTSDQVGTVECMGLQQVLVGDKEVPMTQFLYREGGTVKIEAVVDEKGVLWEMVIDGNQVVRLKDADEK